MREEIGEMLINALITRIQCTHNGVIGEEIADHNNHNDQAISITRSASLA